VSEDDVRGLLGAYALDAVDADERAAVERLVAADPEAARELADLQAVAAALGAAVSAEPPAELRASVLAAVAREAEPALPVVRQAKPRFAQRWWSLAAAVVIGAAVPSVLLVQQHQRAQEAAHQQQAIADVLRDPSAVLVHGEVAGGGTATAVLAADDAVFSASGLPALADGKVYQLWVVSGDEAASAGVLTADGGTARKLADDYSSGDALAMTVEPAGGSQQPTTTPVVVLAPS